MTSLAPRCPTGCGRVRRTGMLMCGPCWRQVPKDIQAWVYSTWRRYQRTDATEDYEAWQEAREAAIASIP